MRSRTGNKMLASYAAWKRRSKGPLWSAWEDRLVDRYARALVRGEYRSSRVAAVACQEELEPLRRRHPDAAWAVAPRSLCAVRIRIIHRAQALGGRWPESHWAVAECRIAERHARRFLSGRCPSMKQAARDCKQELDRTLGAPSGAGRPVSHRPFYGVYSRIVGLARRDGWSRPDGYWSGEEKRITARYARGVVRGRYPSVDAAARACLAEFDRLRRLQPAPAWLARRRRFLGISRMVCRQSLEFGRPMKMPDWTPAEVRRVDRLVRDIIAGRYRDAVQAARVFRRESGRVGVRRSSRAVQGKICERARALGRPPVRRPWSSAELDVLAKYARGLEGNRLDSLHAAARQCRHDLERLRSKGSRRLPVRTESAVIARLRKLTLARGRRWRRWWSSAETAARDRWTRRYAKWRQAGESGALARAVDGLLRDLTRVGSRRSRQACIHQLTRRLRRGAAGKQAR